MREINRDFKILIILSKRWIEELSQFCNSCLIISLGDPVKSTTQGINDRYFMWNPLCSRIMWIIGLLHVLIGPNMWNTLKFVLPQFYGKLCRSSNFLNSRGICRKLNICPHDDCRTLYHHRNRLSDHQLKSTWQQRFGISQYLRSSIDLDSPQQSPPDTIRRKSWK